MEFPILEVNPNNYDFSESGFRERLEPQKIEKFKTLLNKYAECFSNVPAMIHLAEHDIVLTKEEVVRSRPDSNSQRQNEIFKN